MQNLVFEWVDLHIFPNLSQHWLKLKEICERNEIILVKIWPKIGPISLYMGRFFCKTRYLYGPLSNSQWHVSTETTV